MYSSSKGTWNKRPYIYNKYVNLHTQICPSKSYARQNVTIYTKEGKMKNRKHSWPKRNICYPLIASDNFFVHFLPQLGGNKTLALIQNTCSFSVTVSISNIQTVTAGVEAVIWKSTWWERQGGWLFLKRSFHTRPSPGYPAESRGYRQRPYNISHMLLKDNQTL